MSDSCSLDSSLSIRTIIRTKSQSYRQHDAATGPGDHMVLGGTGVIGVEEVVLVEQIEAVELQRDVWRGAVRQHRIPDYEARHAGGRAAVSEAPVEPVEAGADFPGAG